MPVVLALLILGTTAWLAVDASKRDWSDSKVAKNLPTWVVGSLLLWIIVFPLYVFSERKKAPLLKPEAAPEPPVAEEPAPGPLPQAPSPAPAAALETPMQAEAFGPSVDEVAAPERAVEVGAEPIVEVKPEPVVEIADEPEPVVEIADEPEPAVEVEPIVEPIVAFEPEVEPIVSIEPPTEPVVETEPEPAVEIPSVDWGALAAADQAEPAPDVDEPIAAEEPAPLDEPIAPPADEAPAGLALDAFENIKPVSFGAFTASDAEVEPEPAVEVEPETEPVVEPEPLVAEVQIEPEPTKRGSKFNPELKLPSFGKKKNKTAGPSPLTDDELVMLEVLTEMGPLTAEQMGGELEGGTVEEIEAVLHSLTRKRRVQTATHSDGPGLLYSIAAEGEPKPGKKKGRKFNPELKLPKLSLGRKQKPAKAEPAGDSKPAAKSAGKGGFLALPPQLQGPLNDLERKIVLGSVVAVVAAAAFGYSTAPQDEEPVAAPAPAAPATVR